jgi:hypothetical protein
MKWIGRASFTGLVLASLAVGACSSESPPPGGGPGGGACATDTRKDTYVAGLSKSASNLSVRIVDATPAPPAKGTNAITLQVLDAGSRPLDGATITVTPFMPDHGHGSAVAPIVTAAGDGRYSVTKVYLAMAGLWRLTIAVAQPGGGTSEVAFAFCLDG